MPRQCAVCGKQYTTTFTLNKLRGKFNPSSKHKKQPNLQWMDLGDGNRVKACTKCIKTVTKKSH